jgi:hypothetical protein
MQLFMIMSTLHVSDNGEEKDARKPEQRVPAGYYDRALFYALNGISLLYLAVLSTLSSQDPNRSSSAGFAILITRSCLVAPCILVHILPVSSHVALQDVADSTQKIFLAGSAALVVQQLLVVLRDQDAAALSSAWNASAPVRTLATDMVLGLLSLAFRRAGTV